MDHDRRPRSRALCAPLGAAAVAVMVLAACDHRAAVDQRTAPATHTDVVTAVRPLDEPSKERSDGTDAPGDDTPPALSTAGDGRAGGVAAAPRPGRYVESFDGDPAGPRPWRPDGWDVAVHSRDVDTWHRLEATDAAHGPDCGPPPATHAVSAYDDAVYRCRDHVMTAINASGYGAIYLTPNRMVDFSAGTATVSIDVSTLRTSSRDWWDLWVTPYEDNLQTPLEDWLPDLAGPPRNAVQITLNDDNAAVPRVYREHRETLLDSEWWTGYDAFLEPDAGRRDTFELRISRTHLRFGMPAYDHWWVDEQIADLGWDRAVVQLGHHSYSPTKDRSGEPNTWHWDNLTIDPAVPFTIINADRRHVGADTSNVVTLARAAPPEAHLRFSAMGERIEVSFDDGRSWRPARAPRQSASNGLLFSNYWTPIPAGTTRVRIRGGSGWLPSWIAKDFAVWSTHVE